MTHTLSTLSTSKAASKAEFAGPRAHAILPASASKRWLNCTPSARLEEKYGVKTDTSYAAEGTLAHSISSLFLERDLLGKTDGFTEKLEELMANEYFTNDMLDYVDQYVNYCESEVESFRAKGEPAYIYIEEQLDLQEYIPEGFGTSDFGIIADNTLEIVDFKYGMGVPVYADHNTQLMIYALGLLYRYKDICDIQKIVLTIVQPRIDNISSYEMSAQALLDWAQYDLKPKANEAFKGLGTPMAGDWCKFCAVKNRCRALYTEQLKLASEDFGKDANLLSDEEIVDIVKRAPDFITWVNSITEYANTEAVDNNKKWPGLKLVAGRAVRKWLDPDLAESVIRERCPEMPDNVLYTTKLNSLTAIERAVGKGRFATLFADIVVKPEGKPTLVPEDDPRDAIGISQAQKDFAD